MMNVVYKSSTIFVSSFYHNEKKEKLVALQCLTKGVSRNEESLWKNIAHFIKDILSSFPSCDIICYTNLISHFPLFHFFSYLCFIFIKNKYREIGLFGTLFILFSILIPWCLHQKIYVNHSKHILVKAVERG
jgi:hypothetical protein